LTKSWHDRSVYGAILNNLIKKQYATYQKTKDALKKIKLATSISNLISTENSLINDRFDTIKGELDFFAHLEMVTPEELRKDIDRLFESHRTDKEDPKLEKKYKENKKKETIRGYLNDEKAKKSISRGQKERNQRVFWNKENES